MSLTKIKYLKFIAVMVLILSPKSMIEALAQYMVLLRDGENFSMWGVLVGS
jgi:hypothetical protein